MTNLDNCGRNIWELVWQSFSTPIVSIDDFLSRMQVYNKNVDNLNGLKKYVATLTDANDFITVTIPTIAKIALLLPELFGEALPYLLAGQTNSLSITKYQAACLIANAFVCSFPQRDANGVLDKLTLGNFNLTNLLSLDSDSGVLKIKCIVTYLKNIIDEVPDGIITITRYSNVGATESWIGDTTQIMANVGFESETPLQETLNGLTIIDFANCLVGGGFIGHGMLQEETLFACYPELLIARLVVEKLDNDEVVCVTGIQMYSHVHGYGHTATFGGVNDDNTFS